MNSTTIVNSTENITQVQTEQSLKLVIAKNFYYNDCQKAMGRAGRKSLSATQRSKRKEKSGKTPRVCTGILL